MEIVKCSSKDKFLMDDSDPAVVRYFTYLERERAEKKEKENAKEDLASTKNPSWYALHMNVAEKRAFGTM